MQKSNGKPYFFIEFELRLIKTIPHKNLKCSAAHIPLIKVLHFLQNDVSLDQLVYMHARTQHPFMNIIC